jgi:hypothetical protein
MYSVETPYAHPISSDVLFDIRDHSLQQLSFRSVDGDGQLGKVRMAERQGVRAV